MSQQQEEFKTRVRSWLKKSIRKDRQWLADECGVHKRTVDNWLSSKRPIPLRARKLIITKMGQVPLPDQKLDRVAVIVPMEESGVNNEPKPIHILALSLTSEQLSLFNQAANKKDQCILEWIMDSLLDLAGEEKK